MSRLNPSGVLAHHNAHRDYAAMRFLARYDENVTAWLHNLAREVRQAAKQEAPRLAEREASSAHIWYQQNARALDAQSDTAGRQ